MGVKISEDQERVRDFLREQKLGVISTISEDGSPDSAAIYLVINDDLSLSFVTRSDTSKHANIQRDNRVAITVFEPTFQTTVQLKGEAALIHDKSEEQKVFDEVLKIAMTSTDYGEPPVIELKGGKYVTYRIKPTKMRMAVFSRPEQGDYDQIFETVIS